MATHDDAVLMVQLFRWSTEMGVEEAGNTVLAADFDPDAASIRDSPVLKLLTFGEAVATLVKNGLLDRDLVVSVREVGNTHAACS